MTVDPKTIHNLGKDASTAYAQLARVRDEFKSSVVQDPSVIQKIQEFPVLSPQAQSDFNTKYLSKASALTAKFSEPLESAQSAVFTFELIPSLGSFEQFEEPQGLVDKLIQEHLKENPNINDKQLQAIQKEEPIVVRFLSTYHFLSKTLADIQAQRNRFQRG